MEDMQMISCIRFSIQLLISELIFVIGWKPKKPFALWAGAGLAGYWAAALLTFQCLSSFMPGGPVVYVIYYSVLFIYSLLGLRLIFRVNFEELLFAGVCGYATQHIAFAGITIFMQLTGIELSGLADFLLVRILPYVLIDILIYFGMIRKNTGKGELKKRDIRLVLLSFAILFTVIVISCMVDNRIFRENSRYLQNVFCKIYAIVCCLLAIFIAYYMSRQNRIMRENELMENMLRTMNEQQKMSREAVNIINIKCHDLKYRISKISKIENIDDQREYIEDVKDALTIYDNVFHTGNDSLDLVLTEKSLLCNEYAVRFSCMADGKLLQFMHSADIYALFGNLLDNAIECVRQEKDQEKRIISLYLNERSQGVFIHMENYCNSQLVFEDDLPVTTKEDKKYHGFGVRSIRYIVEKYDGEVMMRRQQERFVTDILFYPRLKGEGKKKAETN